MNMDALFGTTSPKWEDPQIYKNGRVFEISYSFPS